MEAGKFSKQNSIIIGYSFNTLLKYGVSLVIFKSLGNNQLKQKVWSIKRAIVQEISNKFKILTGMISILLSVILRHEIIFKNSKSVTGKKYS